MSESTRTMVSRYSVKLNNSSLEAIDDAILILDVHHDPPNYNHATYQIANRQGATVHNKQKEAARVTVDFEIHAYAIDDRQEILDDVIKWARNGGTLEVNDRDGLVLNCICESMPSINSVRNWTDPLSITFTAYGVPYWQDKTATTLTLTGTSASGTKAVPGTGGEAFVTCTVVPSGSMTSLTVTAGSTSITLSDVTVSSGTTVTIGYNSSNVFAITAGGTSLLSSRTSGSADDLRVPSGATSTFSIESNVSVSATFSVCGCWE